MYTILIVDDEPLILKILKEVLQSKNLHILTAQNGLEALETIREQIPHLVLCDVQMPGLNGFGFCEKLRKIHHPPVPFVFMSSELHPHNLRRAYELGALDFIAKPFHLLELRRRLCRHFPGSCPW